MPNPANTQATDPPLQDRLVNIEVTESVYPDAYFNPKTPAGNPSFGLTGGCILGSSSEDLYNTTRLA
jgi:hypothetical protein